MYDCSEAINQESPTLTRSKPSGRPHSLLETDRSTGMTLNGTRLARPGHPAISDLALRKRYPGQSWLRLRSNSADGAHLLAQAQALATQLHAVATPLGDGSLLLRQLSLEQILALSARFAGQLSVSAHIAGAGQHD